MRLFSLAWFPFFLFPLDLTAVAPLDDGHQATEAPAVASPSGRTHRGHRAAPSGCRAASAPGESLSIGTTNEGQLRDGEFLGESERIHHVDADDCRFWGTDELVGAVRRAAATVASRYPGHRLTVGELSQRGGGDIDGHGSHENGRDVDFGFYYLDEAGQPYEPRRLVDVGTDRTAQVGDEMLTFDVERNWALIEALLRDEVVDINIILVNPRIRSWLLAHARSERVPRELYRRASAVMVRPRRGGHPHLNHFHVRIYCPESDGECQDRRPLWSWVERDRARRTARASRQVRTAASPAS